MSEIKTKIQNDLKEAMKSRNQFAVMVLRTLSACIKQVEVDTREEVGDDKIISIIQTEIKKRKDALKFAEDQKRDDLIEQNKTEITLFQQYLGAQFSEDELRSIINNLIKSGCDNIGKIMGALNKDYKGKFDGRLASEIIKQTLSS